MISSITCSFKKIHQDRQEAKKHPWGGASSRLTRAYCQFTTKYEPVNETPCLTVVVLAAPDDNKTASGVEYARRNIVNGDLEHDGSGSAAAARIEAHGVQKRRADARPSVFAQNPER